MAKQSFDEAKGLHEFGEKQNVDFDPLGEAICNEATKVLAELATLYDQLPPVFAKADDARMTEHLQKQRHCIRAFHSAYAALQRAGSEKITDKMMSLSDDYDTSTPLGQAIETLLLEVRTFERIRSELGG